MSLTTRVGLLAGMSALTVAGTSFADNSTEAQDQSARIAELEAKVAQLTGGDWLTEQRADEVRNLVQDVLADADTRASLLQAGMSAGYDNGFVLGSGDGNFSLKMNGQMQWRFIWNNQDDNAAMDNDRWGFENARTKLWFTGNVGGPEWGYFIEGDFFRNGGAFTLEDAWISYNGGDGWTWLAGQMKTPLTREWLVHSQNQLAVERSNVNYLYNGGRVQGLAADYMGDQFHFTGGITDGAATPNTPWSNYDNEWALSARIEFLASGTWGQFTDFTSPQGSEQGMMFGGGVHWQNGEYGTAAMETETLFLTADASLEFDGANIFAAIYYGDMDNGVDTETVGFSVQGGYYFTEDVEGFLRYEWNDFDAAGVDDLSLLTVGLNCYYTDNVTMTADLGFGFDAASSTTDITGWRNDAANDDGQVVFRTQLELTF